LDALCSGMIVDYLCKNSFVMKKYAYALAMSSLLFLSTEGIAQTIQKEVKWETNYQKALGEAKKSGKTLLLNFTGSDWCGWCIRLHNEVFSTPEFVDYAEKNLVCVKLDFPRRSALEPTLAQQNQQLQTQFGVTGYPTIILTNGEGKAMARTGYQAGGPANYVKHLQGYIGQK